MKTSHLNEANLRQLEAFLLRDNYGNKLQIEVEGYHLENRKRICHNPTLYHTETEHNYHVKTPKLLLENSVYVELLRYLDCPWQMAIPCDREDLLEHVQNLLVKIKKNKLQAFIN